MFEKGREYRRRSLHEQYGGSWQAGIAICKHQPIIFLFSKAAAGKLHAYEDKWLPDGRFQYCGEGQTGDQQMLRGNKAVRDHIANRKDLFLFFQNRKAFVKYQGRFVYDGHSFQDVEIEGGLTRKTIHFHLRQAEFQGEEEIIPPPPEFMSHAVHEGTRYQTKTKDSFSPAEQKRRLQWYRQRKSWVRTYALERAMGICEACLKPAPFHKADGSPFLEVHHLFRLADGGPDKPDCVAAICPNCHRRAHHGHDHKEFNAELKRKIDRKEEKLASM